MEITTDLTKANDLLQLYAGSNLQIAFYNESLKRMAIRISKSEISRVIYIVAVGCERMSGHFCHSNVIMAITIETDKRSNEIFTKIVDKVSGFELASSGGFSLAHGLESEFGNSFDDFIKSAE